MYGKRDTSLLLGINFRRQKLIPNNKELSLSKNMLFPRELLYKFNITVKFSLNMQKNLGVQKKSEVWNGRSLVVPLTSRFYRKIYNIQDTKIINHFL